MKIIEPKISQNYSIAEIAKLSRLGDLKSLRFLAKEKGEIEVKRGLIELVTELALFFTSTSPMGKSQVESTVDLILSEKTYLSFDDLKTCFRLAKTLRYGKVYGSVDGAVIFDWINQYEKEKIEVAENQSFIEHNSHKSTHKQTISEMHPDSKRICEEIKARLEADIANDRAEKLKKLGAKNVDYRNYSPEQKWISTFDILFKKKRETVGGFKFIERNGVKMSMTEYLSFRSKKFIKLLNHEIKQ